MKYLMNTIVNLISSKKDIQEKIWRSEIKTTQEKGSYALKHRAEETPFRLFGDVVIGHNYVSNTDMIIAMLHLGFQMNGRHRMEERLNPRFNYSMKSVNSMKPYSVRDKDAA